jgi:hypothetical protein
MNDRTLPMNQPQTKCIRYTSFPHDQTNRAVTCKENDNATTHPSRNASMPSIPMLPASQKMKSVYLKEKKVSTPDLNERLTCTTASRWRPQKTQTMRIKPRGIHFHHDSTLRPHVVHPSTRPPIPLSFINQGTKIGRDLSNPSLNQPINQSIHPHLLVTGRNGCGGRGGTAPV